MLTADQKRALLQLGENVLTPSNFSDARKSADEEVTKHRKYLQDQKNIAIPDHRAIVRVAEVDAILVVCKVDRSLKSLIEGCENSEADLEKENTPKNQLRAYAYSGAVGYFLNFTLK